MIKYSLTWPIHKFAHIHKFSNVIFFQTTCANRKSARRIKRCAYALKSSFAWPIRIWTWTFHKFEHVHLILQTAKWCQLSGSLDIFNMSNKLFFTWTIWVLHGPFTRNYLAHHALLRRCKKGLTTYGTPYTKCKMKSRLSQKCWFSMRKLPLTFQNLFF